MLLDGYGDSIQVFLQSRKRTFWVFWVPDGRSSHSKYLRSVMWSDLIVFTHNSIIGMVLAAMVALVENNERNL